MKINPDYRLRTVAGENMLLNEGVRKVNFNALLTLNEPAAWLWKRAADYCRESGQGFTEEQLVGWLLDEYEVERDVAAEDVHGIVGQWREYGVVED